MANLLRTLLDVPVTVPGESVSAWWRENLARTGAVESTMDRAILGGFIADRVAFAFAAGYEAALRALVPSLPPEALAALCATESGGAHPRAIETSLLPDAGGGLRLEGHKLFVTLATECQVLLVVATTGKDAAGRNRLVLVRVPADAPGVTLTRMPDTPFVPEVPHAELRLHSVRVAAADVLEGDGYARYVKPFRTVEDLHVHGAVLGYVLGIANRFGWPQPVREQLLFLIAGLRGLAELPPDEAGLHVALGGAIAQARRLLDECHPHWATVAPGIRAHWERDAQLLHVAERARSQRLVSAWQRLSGAAGQGD
jgi:hypothetical protein